MRPRPPKPQRPEDCATAWFAVWERARIDGDFNREQQALQELRRLGVVIESAEPRQGVSDADNTPETVAPELLTLRQVAELCQVSERTVWQWARDGISPPALTIGRGTVRYSRAAYVAWIAAGCPRTDGRAGQ